MKYEAPTCHECQQSLNYLLGIDRGTATIVIAIAEAIRRKNTNAVHPRKEMEVTSRNKASAFELAKVGLMKSNSINNLTRARAHGLIAKVKGNAGNYCLTKKGADFLRGERVMKYAIRSKVTNRTEGYFTGPHSGHGMIVSESTPPKEVKKEVQKYTTTLAEALRDGDYWEGINYTIHEGNIIYPQASMQI